MDWVMQHLQVIIAFAGAVAWWLNQRRQARAGGDEPPKENTFDDPELAERTRRIREEIQRKIAERARAYTQPAAPVAADEAPVAPPPIVREVVVSRSEPPLRSKAAAARLETEGTAEILRQQAALTEQLRLAEEMKAASTQRAQFETRISSGAAAAAVARGALGDDLRNPEALRRAIILREILGPPVALR